MTRAAVDDLMQGFRFHVVATPADGSSDPLQFERRGEFEGGGQAGFQSVTLPEVSVEATEYREGTFVWTQKYPGPPTVSDVTLMRGVAKGDTAFHDWVMAGVNGEQYRAQVAIYHYQRTEMGEATGTGLVNDSFRRVVCNNCFGLRAKPAGDFDSMSGEVSLAEVDFSLESFTIELD